MKKKPKILHIFIISVVDDIHLSLIQDTCTMIQQHSYVLWMHTV